VYRGEGGAVVRFSKHADMEPNWKGVQDGIIRNVSLEQFGSSAPGTILSFAVAINLANTQRFQDILPSSGYPGGSSAIGGGVS